MKKLLGVTSVLVWAITIMFFGVTLALAQGNNVITACVAKDGSLRVIALAGQCKDKETPLSWNVQGEQGPPGVLGFYTVTSEVSMPGASLNYGTFARCDLGDAVTGGGYHYVDNFDGSELGVGGIVSMVNRPVESQDGLGEGWKVNVWSDRGINSSLILEVYAICADINT